MKKVLKQIIAIALAATMCMSATGCKFASEYDKLLSDYNALLAQMQREQEDAKNSSSSEKSTSKKASSKKNKASSSSKKSGTSSKNKDTQSSSSKNQSTNSPVNDDIELEVEDFEDIFDDYEFDDSDFEDMDLGELLGIKGYDFVVSSPWMAKTAASAKLEQEKTFFEVADIIEELFGCTITVQGGNINTVESLRPLIMSGSKVADAVDVLASSTLALASAGYIVPWNEIDGMDMTSDVYVKGYSNLAKINGDYYGLSFLRAPEARMCVMFNKGVLKSAGINSDGIYDLVKAKKWNWETLRSYAKTVVQKNTSNNVTHIWGIGGYYQKVASALYMSNGARLAQLKNGVGTVTVTDTNMKEAINFMDKLINEDKVYDASRYRNASTFDTSDNGQYKTMFQSGKLGFMIEECFWLAKYFDKSFDYGIAPVPMGPRATNYITDAGNARVWTCTSTNAKSKDIDKTMIILTLLASGCAYPNDTIDNDDWWQYDLKREYFRNDHDKNLEVYNILLDTAAVDYGAAVTGLQQEFLHSVVRDAVFCRQGTVESRISSVGPMYSSTVARALTLK